MAKEAAAKEQHRRRRRRSSMGSMDGDSEGAAWAAWAAAAKERWRRSSIGGGGEGAAWVAPRAGGEAPKEIGNKERDLSLAFSLCLLFLLTQEGHSIPPEQTGAALRARRGGMPANSMVKGAGNGHFLASISFCRDNTCSMIEESHHLQQKRRTTPSVSMTQHGTTCGTTWHHVAYHIEPAAALSRPSI